MARGGFNGFGAFGNMGNIMKQAQKMQKDMENKQEELAKKEVEATVGGGAVYVKANGKKEILEIKIKPEVLDPDDVEMLEDLVLVAVNEVIKKAEDMFTAEMGKITGGIPGLF
ncbi:MAG: YbaB/EbfC family nucleoid-associated protein [Clostridiales bacterium]|nr:YbaB/EbfC family nucleoid-associated protein [Clostridiales bacterium]